MLNGHANDPEELNEIEFAQWLEQYIQQADDAPLLNHNVAANGQAQGPGLGEAQEPGPENGHQLAEAQGPGPQNGELAEVQEHQDHPMPNINEAGVVEQQQQIEDEAIPDWNDIEGEELGENEVPGVDALNEVINFEDQLMEEPMEEEEQEHIIPISVGVPQQQGELRMHTCASFHDFAIEINRVWSQITELPQFPNPVIDNPLPGNNTVFLAAPPRHILDPEEEIWEVFSTLLTREIVLPI